MSRILVADDNSNIQKMVALALKEEGIDVVAVGNGEAAMRKIPDLRPDLVLADIFMPVRNGYEVCEFVKSDSRYMATPVVLLVGAFDPLDEQETERVRADGVLKKPFVPPDPLINMVKALLAKSNVPKSAPAAEATPAKPAPQPQPTPAPADHPSSSREVGAPPSEASLHYQGEISSPAQEKPAVFPAPTPRAEFQTAHPEQPDEVITAVRDPNLGQPFWATPAEAEEPEEKSEPEPEDMVDMHSFGKDESSAERAGGISFEPDSALLDSANSGSDLGETIVLQDEAASPLERDRPQPTAAGEYDDRNAVAGQPESQAPSSSSEPPETPAEIFKFDPTLTFPAVTQDAPNGERSAEADRASYGESSLLEPPVGQNAATPSRPGVTDSSAHPPARAEKPVHTREPIEPVGKGWPALPNQDAVIRAATETARLALSELNPLAGFGTSAESSDRNARAAEHLESSSASAPVNSPLSPTPEMIEAVVSRLLERMQPEIMEVVNREVLRPAIEAIVRREMKKN